MAKQLNTYNNKSPLTAFSLVELMVVIAIVAILAAVAIPVYKNYIVRTNIQSAFGVFDKIKKQSIEYAAINDTFPNITDLGYAEADGDPKQTDFADIPQIYRLVFSPSDNGKCGVFNIVYDIDGIGLSTADYFSIYTTGYIYQDTDGMYKVSCVDIVLDSTPAAVEVDPGYFTGVCGFGSAGFTAIENTNTTFCSP